MTIKELFGHKTPSLKSVLSVTEIVLAVTDSDHDESPRRKQIFSGDTEPRTIVTAARHDRTTPKNYV
jgi:hypothetical protein